MDLNTQKALASLGSAMNGYQAALTPWALPVNQPPNQMPDMTGTGSASTASWLPLIHDQLTKMGTSLANLEKASKPAPNKETSQQSQMQGGGSSDPLQAWANQYLRSLGGKLGGQVSQYFGNDAGRLAQTGYQQLFDRAQFANAAQAQRFGQSAFNVQNYNNAQQQMNQNYNNAAQTMYGNYLN